MCWNLNWILARCRLILFFFECCNSRLESCNCLRCLRKWSKILLVLECEKVFRLVFYHRRTWNKKTTRAGQADSTAVKFGNNFAIFSVCFMTKGDCFVFSFALFVVISFEDDLVREPACYINFESVFLTSGIDLFRSWYKNWFSPSNFL